MSQSTRPIDNRAAIQACLRSLLVAALLFFAAACGGGSSGGDAPAQTGVVGGQVLSGNNVPVIGSTVTVYAAGTSGYGSTPTQLGRTTTDSVGSFEIANIVCPAPSSQVYVVATGGNTIRAGFPSDPAIVLMAVIGACNQITGGTDEFDVNIDELTTTASAYALAPFISRSNAQQVGTSSTNLIGLSNAALTLNNLVDVVNGVQARTLANNPFALEILDTLADVLAACVQSGFPSRSCEQLFASVPGQSIPVNDTLTAAFAVALAPQVPLSAELFSLLPANPSFQPVLSAAPSVWTIDLNFTGGGLSQPFWVAIDGVGSPWIANFGGSSVTKLTSNGSPVSPASGFTGGGLNNPTSIAIDSTGNAWIANRGGNSVTKLDSDGNPLSPASGFTGGGLNDPQGIAVDSKGNVWTANLDNNNVTKLDNLGTPISPPSGFTGGGLSLPETIAVDNAGNAWITNGSGNSVTGLAPNGSPLPHVPFTGAGLSGPFGIALDSSGNIWAVNLFGNSVSKFNQNGLAFPNTPFVGGGLNDPSEIAIGSAGDSWISNSNGNSISELASDGHSIAVFSAPPIGLADPQGVAIDASGNLWVVNFMGNSVTEFIGVASPIKTPLNGNPTLP